MEKNTVIKKIFSNEDYLSGISLSRKKNYEMDYFTTKEKKNVVSVIDYYKNIHDKIVAKFPNYNYKISDVTDDESKYFIFIHSNKLYRVYYSYDTKNEEFTLLYNLMP